MTTKLERIENMEAELAALKKELEVEGKKTGKRWRAEFGGRYFIVEDCGTVFGSIEDNDEYDDKRWLVGNYYKTEEEAQKVVDKQLATMRVSDRINEINAQEGWVLDWDNTLDDKHSIVYKGNRGSLDYCIWAHTIPHISVFGCLKAIKTVIEEMPEDCKLMLGVN